MLNEIVFSFDTTGSMYPCLAEVRRKVEATAKQLFTVIPELRIGIIAHGDYCDKNTTYVTKHLQLTADKNAISYFVQNVEKTYGGDAPECYELVLHEASSFNWTPGSKRLLVMIGDDVPHPPAHNPQRLDWRECAKRLTNIGVAVHGVQALNRSHATRFYSELASLTGGFHLPLSQFNDVTELLLAVSYQQFSQASLDDYEQELVTNNRMTRSLSDIFAKLQRRDPTTGRFRKVDGAAVEPGRFQVIHVPHDMPIKELVESNGLEFKTGRGFYEFTKREKIQEYKEVIVMHRDTGDMYEGGHAREIMGMTTESKTSKAAPVASSQHMVFVQSTSNNRKLIGGTKFLYEV